MRKACEDPDQIKAEVMERVQLMYPGDQEKQEHHKKIVKNALNRLAVLMEVKKKKNLKVILNSLNHIGLKGSKDPSSKHIVLAFSGFLSQQDCSLDSWNSLHGNMSPIGLSVYDVKWESILYTDLQQSSMKGVGSYLFQEGINLVAAPGGAALRVIRYARAGMQFKKLFYDSLLVGVEKLFKQAIENAKMTGKLLAVALALGFPFTTQTISLIGFSLGSQVIKSTIKTLHKIGVHDLIQNVHFLGGACH